MDTSVTSNNLSPMEEIHEFLMGKGSVLRPASHYEVARFINARVKQYQPRLKYLGFDELLRTHGPGVGPHVSTSVPDDLRRQLERTHLVFVCHHFEPDHTGRGVYLYLTRRGTWLSLECTEYGALWGYTWARKLTELAGIIASVNARRGGQTFGIDILKGLKAAYNRAREDLARRDAELASDVLSLEMDIVRLAALNKPKRR